MGYSTSLNNQVIGSSWHLPQSDTHFWAMEIFSTLHLGHFHFPIQFNPLNGFWDIMIIAG